MLGQLIGDRFRVERLCAQGGYGSIYRAEDLQTAAPAAIKVLRADLPRLEEQFASEARILAELRHPGIVEYVAHGQTPDGDSFLAMEWLEGEDLANRLLARELTTAESLHLVTRAAAALALAHARRIVHRDLKPQNLYLVDGSVSCVKILDFGCALSAGSQPRAEVAGTTIFIAPEQARRDTKVDPRADVFSLGVVLFRCLTGCYPFPGGDTADELLDRQRVLREVPQVRALRPELPDALADLVASTLDIDPARRPHDAAAVLAALLAVAVRPAVANGLPSAESADVCSDRAQHHVSLGDTEQARTCFDRALELDPRHLEARNNRAVFLFAQGAYDEALADLEVLIAAGRVDADVHQNRAAALLALGRHENALAAVDQAIHISPFDPDLHGLKAGIHHAMKDHRASRAAVERGLRLAPNDPDLLDSLATLSKTSGSGDNG